MIKCSGIDIRSATCIRPFLKWAGGKCQIINKIRESLPKGNRLIEPFVGSGAVFLNSDYERFLIADINNDLINTFIYLKVEKGIFIDFCKQFFTTDSCYARSILSCHFFKLLPGNLVRSNNQFILNGKVI